MSAKKKMIIIIAASVALIAVILGVSLGVYYGWANKYELLSSPAGLSKYSKLPRKAINNADFYVSVKDGSDDNDGSISSPFKSIERAQAAVRELAAGANKDIIVAVKGGKYELSEPLAFGAEDYISGHKITYAAYDDEEVILSGGRNIAVSAFSPLTGQDKERLGNAANNVKTVNLFDLGITKEQIGRLYSFGGFPQGVKYGEEQNHPSDVQVYFGGKRMNIARYPNEGYDTIGRIIDHGEVRDNEGDKVDWDTVVAPRPPKFIAEEGMRARMKKWRKPADRLNKIWAYGYFFWDWADASTPIKDFDADSGRIDCEYSSPYGIKTGGIYYVYNVFEELDAEGEYYIDRETGNMYVYIPDGTSEDMQVSISLATDSLINANGVKNITFDGFTIENTRAGGITVNGNNCAVKNCLIRNVAGDGITVRGKENIAENNEVTNVGKSAIVAGNSIGYKEGDVSDDIRRNGLVIENNIIRNNYLHSYGEIQRTYTAGIYLSGVGNKAAHNEISDAPHMGIFYEGNEHIIEYNYLHHVVLNSSDAGAIYAGRNLSYYGNVLRYNCIADIGSGEFTPSGIYFDDCLSGQTAYGNILVNIPNYGFLIGGGRDNAVYDNVIINAKEPIFYDARAYDGYYSDTWYSSFSKEDNVRQWNLLKDAKTLYNVWREKSADIIGDRYEGIARMQGYTNATDINSAITPNSMCKNNVCVTKDGRIGHIEAPCKKYGDISGNKGYKYDEIKSSFIDFDGGYYKLSGEGAIKKDLPNINIPYDIIGIEREN